MLQTRSQRFASSAFDNVDALKASAGRDKYKAITRNLPVLIRTAGLAQALAFVPSGEEQKRMHEMLVGHLSVTLGTKLVDACRDRNLPLEEYMRLTRATLDALVWYKRFAESLITD
ncbi:MAG: type III-B CRISPR module-associated protein Cmr5 [Pyrinomonadaceae bacterium]